MRVSCLSLLIGSLFLASCFRPASVVTVDSVVDSSSIAADGGQVALQDDSCIVVDKPRFVRSSGPGDPSGFVMLHDVVPDVILEMRYFSTYNFVGKRIDGYNAPVALCSREAAEALATAAEELASQGYRIKVYDAYRPQSAVDHFARWGRNLSDTAMRQVFYPEVDKSLVFALGYVAHHSGHTRGSTFDLTIVDVRTGLEVDMGGTFDYFGPRSSYGYSKLTDEQRHNRAILRNAMMDAGFRPYGQEWWHFTLRNEPYPNTYFTFPVDILNHE